MNVTPDEVPKQVGRYEIVELVGFGAMGAVYKARDPLINRTVAIKTIRLDVPPDSPHYQTFLQRFYTEARISGTLSHPNVVTLYDIGETEDKIPFLAMEYIDGETVADMLAGREQLQPEQVVALVSQMAAAIDYAHGKGVIHRDIKPSNIIVYDGEKVKVTDFGIAKLMDAEGTQTASLLGTPSYMSPEQAMGEDLDGRTDIFSLGVVAFEMLSGEQPFPGNNITSILYKLVHADPVRPTNLEILGLLPDKWHQVFSKVLAKNPAERYRTAAEFVSDLELCLGSWFGALEGETVVMASDATVVGPKGTTLGAPRVVAESEQRDSEETIMLGSAETRVDMKPLSERDPSVSETLPPLNEHELETVLLSPPPIPDSETTRTIEKGSGLGPPQTATPIRDMEPPETETIALYVREGRTAPDATEQRQAISPDEETLAILPPETSTTATAQRPVTDRKTRDSGRSKKLPALALAAVAVVAIGLGALYRVSWAPRSTPPPPFEPTPIEPMPATGTLIVRSSPDGALVRIDGEERGETPLELGEMQMGLHTVSLEKVGYRSVELAAELSESQFVATIDVPLKRVETVSRPAVRAFLDIRSAPADAAVLIDGKPVGNTPIERFQVSPGRRVLTIQKKGFKPWETSVEVVAGVDGTVNAQLEPMAEEKPPPPEKPAVPEVKAGDLVERGPDVIDPECIECPNVPYPELAKDARLEGVVEVSFIVTETGAVEDIRIEESGGEVFDAPVIEVLKGWRYRPATKQGKPVKVRLNRRFRFRRGR